MHVYSISRRIFSNNNKTPTQITCHQLKQQQQLGKESRPCCCIHKHIYYIGTTNQHNNSCPCRHSMREPCESQEEYNVVTAPATASSWFSEHLYHRNDARIPPRVLLCFCCWCCCRLCWRFLHCRWMIFLVLRYKATQFVWLWCKRALTQSHSLFDSLLQHSRRQQSVAVAENMFG